MFFKEFCMGCWKVEYAEYAHGINLSCDCYECSQVKIEQQITENPIFIDFLKKVTIFKGTKSE